MEGVGARLGRSSTRYGPATVFTGPVRKWKKRWIPFTPSNNSSNSTNHNHHHHSAVTNGNNGSHLLLYKWAPTTPSQNGITGHGNGNGNGKNTVDNDADESQNDAVGGGEDEQQPRKRKFKYIPVAVLEEQKNELSEQGEDEAKPMETETETEGREPTSKNDDFDEKPDINGTPADESQVHEVNHRERQDLNESTLDLSLGLKARDGENDADSKTNQIKEV